MIKLTFHSLFAFSLIVFSAISSYATDYSGEIVKMNASRLELEIKGSGKRIFQVTKMTRVSVDGGIAVVHRLPKGSKVRVVEKNNQVDLIVVEEVPK